MESNDQQSGVSRRDLMKKGAVAGGIAWTAPILMSATDVAGAQTGGGSPVNCTTFYVGKFEADDVANIIPGSCDAGHGAGSCYKDSGNPGYVAGRTYESGCDTVVSAEGNTIVLHKHLNGDTSQPQIQSVTGYTKGGGACAAATRSTNADGNWVLVFPLETPGGAFSNVQFSFCV